MSVLAVVLSSLSVASAGDRLVLDASLSGVSTAFDGSGPTTGLALGARGDLLRFYGSVEGQAVTGDYWSGRASAGLDLLHRMDAVDVEVGLFSGIGGGLANPSVSVAPLTGADLGVGLSLGRVGLSVRHSVELASSWASDRVRLSVDVRERARVFGQYSRVTPGPDAVGRDAFGVGIALVF